MLKLSENVYIRFPVAAEQLGIRGKRDGCSPTMEDNIMLTCGGIMSILYSFVIVCSAK